MSIQCAPLAALHHLGQGFGCGVPSAPSSCSGATLPPSLIDRAGLTPMGASSTRVSKESCHAHNCIRCFYFFVAKSSSLCSDLSFGSCAWAVLLGLVAKKRLSFP